MQPVLSVVSRGKLRLVQTAAKAEGNAAPRKKELASSFTLYSWSQNSSWEKLLLTTFFDLQLSNGRETNGTRPLQIDVLRKRQPYFVFFLLTGFHLPLILPSQIRGTWNCPVGLESESLRSAGVGEAARVLSEKNRARSACSAPVFPQSTSCEAELYRPRRGIGVLHCFFCDGVSVGFFACPLPNTPGSKLHFTPARTWSHMRRLCRSQRSKIRGFPALGREPESARSGWQL